MTEKKHYIEFKKRISSSYLYKSYNTKAQIEKLRETCLEAIRKRLKWLYQLSDEELVKHLEEHEE